MKRSLFPSARRSFLRFGLALLPLSSACAISLSPNGRYLAYEEGAAVILKDTQTGTSRKVADGSSPVLSADGNWLVYETGATNSDIALLSLATANATPTIVSLSSTGGAAAGGSFGSSNPSLSANGALIAFDSDASNLVSPDDAKRDVFYRDVALAKTFRVGPGAYARLSADGQFIAFQRTVDLTGIHTFLYRISDGALTPLSDLPSATYSPPDLSADGRYIVYLAGNQVYFSDRLSSNPPRRISTSFDGASAANAECSFPVISPEGRFIAWRSRATNLVRDDLNDAEDVFVHDRTSGLTAALALSDRNTFSRDMALADAPLRLALQTTAGTQEIVTGVGAVVLVSPPANATAGNNGFLSLSAAAMGPSVNYQWLFNGQEIAGATSNILNLNGVTASQAGQYSVRVQNISGSLVSPAATLTVRPPSTSRLMNVSIRGRAMSGAGVLTAGFVVSGENKDVLIRALGGATLAGRGVPNVLANPFLELFHINNGAASKIRENDNWGQHEGASALPALFTRLGAGSDLAPGSLDSVLYLKNVSGIHTAQVSGPDSGANNVLIEVFDASEGTATTAAPKVVNMSARGNVGTGASIMTVGFVLNQPKQVLVRAIGPTLADYGLPAGSLLANPSLKLLRITGPGVSSPVAINDNWGTVENPALVSAAATKMGAFALPATSNDAALLIELPAGVYTAEASGVNNSTGIALVEIYEVDS